MKPRQAPEKSSETPRDQFQTPRRPSPAGTSLTSRSTTSKRTAPPSLPISARPWKLNSLPNSRAQSTLTQIDFVTQNTTRADDDELDYIDEIGTRQGTPTMNEPAQIDDGSEVDTDYRPPLRSRQNTTKFERNDDHRKRRRKSAGVNDRASTRQQSVRKRQAPRSSMSNKGKGKSTEKPTAKRDKTLTQMDFVRRYITIEDDDDDDANMGYIQPDPQNTTAKDGKETPQPARDIAQPEPRTSTKRNRRFSEAELDLSTGEPLSGGGDTQNTNTGATTHDLPVLTAPITPQKNRKLEIPSSQSPESPGLAFITSSQFRSATRSPGKQNSTGLAQRPENTIKKESPGRRRIVEVAQGLDESVQGTPTQRSREALEPIKQQSSPPVGGATSSISSTEPSSQIVPPEDSEPTIPRTQRERTVVYETDAESDHSDVDDGMDQNSVTQTRGRVQHARASRLSQHSPEPSACGSPELPPPDLHRYTGADPGPASEAPMSDASIYYQRMQPATQFPHEPVPALNTQKLSEFFPNEGSTQYPRFSATKPPQLLPGSSTQSRTESQDVDQTEIVPESSPVQESGNSIQEDHARFRRPRVPESVVQVESSQPVDRGSQSLGGLLSRSQLLTSSVMESVPLPQFCMGSQDSVGEPYSLPDQ